MKRTIEFSQLIDHLHSVTVDVADEDVLNKAIMVIQHQGSVTDVVSALNDLVGVKVVAPHRELEQNKEPMIYLDDFKPEEVEA